jgi:hypothetical protein
VLVDRAPQLPQPAVDPDEHLVEVPRVAWARAPPAQRVGVGLPELGAPPPDRLVTHRDTAYQHQLLDLTKAQREPKVKPHAVVDDLDRGRVARGNRTPGSHRTVLDSLPLHGSCHLGHQRMGHLCPVSSPVSSRVLLMCLEGSVFGGVVGDPVMPAAPDDVEPGAGQDAYGVGMVVAAGDGAAVEIGRPDVGVAGVAAAAVWARD